VCVCVCVCVDEPIMSDRSVKIAVDAQQSAELMCRARGWPVPTMTWSRRSTSLTDNNKYQIMATRDTSIGRFPFVSLLKISSVHQDDFGIYTCTARNNMGATVTHFNLTVKSKPVFALLGICTYHTVDAACADVDINQ